MTTLYAHAKKEDWTKWLPEQEFKKRYPDREPNYRTVYPDEVIHETDYPKASTNKECSLKMAELMEQAGYSGEVWYTGNKSYPIHSRWENLPTDKETRKRTIKLLTEKIAGPELAGSFDPANWDPRRLIGMENRPSRITGKNKELVKKFGTGKINVIPGNILESEKAKERKESTQFGGGGKISTTDTGKTREMQEIPIVSPHTMKRIMDGHTEPGRHTSTWIVVKELYHAGFSDAQIMEYALQHNRNCTPPKAEYIIRNHVDYLLANPHYLEKKETTPPAQAEIKEWVNKKGTIDFILPKVKDREYFRNLKRNKSYTVNGVLYPGTLNMIYSPPKNFKSLLSLKLAHCVANGLPFMGRKTKKGAVMICDNENGEQQIKERWEGIERGSGKRAYKYPLHYVNGGSLDNPQFVDWLYSEVKERGVKLLFIDTLRRWTGLDENNSQEVSRMYHVLRPFFTELECCVVLLHHSNKMGDYRGSIDLEGMLETMFKIKRPSMEKTEFRFFIECSRRGSELDVAGAFRFEENSITLEEVSRADAPEKTEDDAVWKLAHNHIRTLFPMVGASMKRKDILTDFRMNPNRDISGISDKTIDNALSWMYRKDKLDRDKGLYTRKWATEGR